MADIKADTIALRDRAWAEIRAAPNFVLFKALDDAVAAAGGLSVLRRLETVSRVADFQNVGPAVAAVAIGAPAPRFYAGGEALPVRRRISQGDAAAMVLRERGPSTSVALLNAIPEKGGTIGGEKPMINLTSTLSKDSRFVSFRHEGSYFWWFANEALPPDWNTGTGLDFSEEPAPVSVPSNQETADADNT